MADKKKISADNAAAQSSGPGLGVWALAAIVVSSMIGGGQNTESIGNKINADTCNYPR